MDEKPLNKLQIIRGVGEVLDNSQSSYINRDSIRDQFNLNRPKCSREQIDEAVGFLVKRGKVEERWIGGENRYMRLKADKS